jgi:ABC-type spermidine/putrescine transport system permease subunit I
VRRARIRGLLMVAPPIAVIALFIGYPVVAAVLYTLGHTGGTNSVIASFAQRQHVSTGGAGTTAAYREVLTDHQFLRDLMVTVTVTLITVVVVLLLAGGVALYLRLSGSRVARFLSGLVVVPMFIPVVIGGYAIRQFYAGDGLFRTLADHLGWHNAPTLSYTMGAITVGEIWVSIPFAVLMLASGFNAIPDAQIEAARDVGASMARTVFTVLLPMSRTPIVIATTFTAISVLGSFTIPYMTGPAAPNMLGVTMTNYFVSFGRPQQAEVMAVVVFAAAALIGSAYVWANVRAGKASGAGS